MIIIHYHYWLSSRLTASSLSFVTIQVALQLTSKLLREQRQQLDIFSRYIFLLASGKRWHFQSRALLLVSFGPLVLLSLLMVSWNGHLTSSDWLCVSVCNVLGLFGTFCGLVTLENMLNIFLDASWQGNGDSILSKVTSKLPELSSSILGHAWSNLLQLQNKIMPLFYI